MTDWATILSHQVEFLMGETITASTLSTLPFKLPFWTQGSGKNARKREEALYTDSSNETPIGAMLSL